jgi:hypothetical protein
MPSIQRAAGAALQCCYNETESSIGKDANECKCSRKRVCALFRGLFVACGSRCAGEEQDADDDDEDDDEDDVVVVVVDDDDNQNIIDYCNNL